MSPSPMSWLIGVGLLGLVPFVLVMMTSFVKMAVVLSIARSAIGTPQVPPSSVITGLAFCLSLSVMAPVAQEMFDRSDSFVEALQKGSLTELREKLSGLAEPLKGFLERHARPEKLQAFAREDSTGETGGQLSWSTLIPAFLVSELDGAFRMGFLLFLPFLVLDMLVASVLLSLGMHMLSPTSVSLPLKLLLFVMADGWTLIGTSLVSSYR